MENHLQTYLGSGYVTVVARRVSQKGKQSGEICPTKKKAAFGGVSSVANKVGFAVAGEDATSQGLRKVNGTGAYVYDIV